jgi:hypothetical protein
VRAYDIPCNRRWRGWQGPESRVAASHFLCRLQLTELTEDTCEVFRVCVHVRGRSIQAFHAQGLEIMILAVKRKPTWMFWDHQSAQFVVLADACKLAEATRYPRSKFEKNMRVALLEHPLDMFVPVIQIARKLHMIVVPGLCLIDVRTCLVVISCRLITFDSGMIVMSTPE